MKKYLILTFIFIYLLTSITCYAKPIEELVNGYSCVNDPGFKENYEKFVNSKDVSDEALIRLRELKYDIDENYIKLGTPYKILVQGDSNEKACDKFREITYEKTFDAYKYLMIGNYKNAFDLMSYMYIIPVIATKDIPNWYKGFKTGDDVGYYYYQRLYVNEEANKDMGFRFNFAYHPVVADFFTDSDKVIKFLKEKGIYEADCYQLFSTFVGQFMYINKNKKGLFMPLNNIWSYTWKYQQIYEQDNKSIQAILLREAERYKYGVQYYDACPSKPVIIIDKKPLIYDVKTLSTEQYEGKRGTVPIRVITEALGVKISWNDESQTATVINGDKIFECTIGSKTYKVNGTKYECEKEPILIFDTTHIEFGLLEKFLNVKNLEYDDLANIYSMETYN